MFESETIDILLQSQFLARTLLALPCEPDVSIPTFATDGRRILFNPGFVAELSQAEICGCLVHECLHCILGHSVRRGDRDHRRWNIATDYKVNQYVEEAGYVLPGVALRDGAFDSLTEDAIYARLPEAKTVCTCTLQDMTGNGRPLSPQEIERELARVTEAQAALQWGKLPAGLARDLATATSPRYTVAQQIEVWLSRQMTDREEWSRPNRDYPAEYLPSRRIERRGRIALCIDTSGSIDDALLSRFLAEAWGIIERCTVHVIFADAAVATEGECETVAQVRAAFAAAKGGGGTDFRPAIRRAMEVEADGIIYLTDGLGTYPDSCECPLLWAIHGTTVAPLGVTITLE